MDRVTISAYWGPRRESIAQCSQRLAHHFEALAAASDNLAHWCHRGSRRGQANNPANVHSSESLLAMLKSGANRRDDNGSVISELGFGVGLWNGEFGGWSASTDVKCGLYSMTKGLSNLAMLGIDFDLKPALSPPEMVQLLKRFVEIWEPDSGKVWQSYWWPNAEAENAEFRERTYASFRASYKQGDESDNLRATERGRFADGLLWIDHTQEPFFRQAFSSNT